MATLSFFLSLLFLISCTSYKRVHRDAIVIDTHNDVISTVSMRGMNIDNDLSPQTHSDVKRFLQSGIDIQVFSIFSDERFGKDTAFKYANIEIDSLYAIASRNFRNGWRMVYDPTDLDAVTRERLFGVMMGLEGGHMIEDNLDYIDSFYKRGVRYMTLTWNNSTSWASSAWDETKGTVKHKGLNEFGKQVVRRMNELGMIVDVSHVGEQTFWDVLSTTTRPIIASHSCAHTLCPVPRNLKDEQIKAFTKNGGVIHLNFYSGFIDSNYQARLDASNQKHQWEIDSLTTLKWADWEIEEWLAKQYPAEAENLRPPLSMLLDHFDHIVKLAGIDHVGIGSDFDGISSSPRQLNDVTDMPKLTKALLKRGYSKQEVKKILGGNFIRVFRVNQTFHCETVKLSNAQTSIVLRPNDYSVSETSRDYEITIHSAAMREKISAMAVREIVFCMNGRQIIARWIAATQSAVPNNAEAFFSYTGFQGNENTIQLRKIDPYKNPYRKK